MPTISNLSVSITASTEKFIKGITLAVNKLKDFSLAAVKYGAATSAAFAAGTAVLVKEQMQAIDEMAKWSDRTGIATEKLAGLQHAANLSGVSIDDLRTSLDIFVKKLPAGTDIGAAFLELSDRITAVRDPVMRAHLAVENFGKSGAKMIPLLTSNLREAQTDAAALGLTFSRIDAAQVEQANDAMERLWSAIKGAGNALSIQLSPFIEAAANKLTEMGTSGKGVTENVARGFERILLLTGGLIDTSSLLVGVWDQWVAEINGLAEPLRKVATLIVGAVSGPAAASLYYDMTKGIETYSKTAEEYNQKAGKSIGEWVRGENAGKALKFFKEIQNASKRTAEKTAIDVKNMSYSQQTAGDKAWMSGPFEYSAIAKQKEQPPKKEPQLEAIGGFRQISEHLLSISGLSALAKKMEVHDPQLKETNAILKQMLDKPAGSGEAVYH